MQLVQTCVDVKEHAIKQREHHLLQTASGVLEAFELVVRSL